MSLFNIFSIASSGMSAQSLRLNTTASNMSNAENKAGDPNEVYKARHPVFEAVLQGQINDPNSVAVRVSDVVESQLPAIPLYEPGNPMANKDGYVFKPDINPVEEMVDMINASRSYEMNAEVMNTAKQMMLKTLEKMQS